MPADVFVHLSCRDELLILQPFSFVTLEMVGSSGMKDQIWFESGFWREG